MIKSFKNKVTKAIAEDYFVSSFSKEISLVARRKLRMIEYAKTLDELRTPPSNHLEALKGSRKGQYSIRINKQWRICFVWEDGHAYDVEIVDYH